MSKARNKQDNLWGAIYALWQWSMCITVTFVMLTLVLPFMMIRAGKIILAVSRIWSRILARILGLKVEIENGAVWEKTRSSILLVNHQSYLDILALYQALPMPVVWMAKDSLFKIPLFGWAMSATGCIPVKRDTAHKARESLYKAAMLVRKDRHLVIFPEGTRGRPDGSLIPFKKGAFVLAKMAEVPLQPLTMYGPNLILPIQRKTIIPRFYSDNVIRIVIHQIIKPDDYVDLSANQLHDRIYDTIKRPIDRLKKFNEILDNGN